METSVPACSPVRGIAAIPAFKDNYIWLLHRDGRAVVVDPGDAGPVKVALTTMGLSLEAILITHHHADHCGGIPELLAMAGQIPVFGPAAESITGISTPLSGGEALPLPGIGLELQVLPVPGHTRGHLAYQGSWEGRSVLFCGDTLFGAGCGRLFEGTPAQMAASLGRLAALPAETAVFCAHEYTATNLGFAAAVEPDNPDIARRILQVESLRAQGLATVPSTLAEELRTNPFLRCGVAAVQARAEAQAGRALDDEVAVFATLREWRNGY